MNTVRTNSIKTAVETVNASLQSHTDCLVIYIGNSLCVLRGRAAMYDRELCQELNLPVGRSIYTGGVIVCGAGDLSMCLVTQEYSNFGPDASRLLKDFYMTKGLAVSSDRNDILIDGRKITSWSRTHYEGMWQNVLHVSINSDVDLIRRICKKPMVKVPGSLKDYGITANDCLVVIQSLLQEDDVQ